MSTPVIETRQLGKTYGSAEVVKNFALTVTAGECCGILGPNGAGKTTTLRMFIGHTPPTAGELSVLGQAIPARARAMRAFIGVVPQQDNLDPDFTVTENLAVYGRFFGLSRQVLNARIPKLLGFAALEHKAQARVTELSGGMQRRLSLARALINEPRLLILDEPTTGLDPQARQHIWQRLRELKNTGLTLILTTHYMEEAERLCDRVIIMDHGEILAEGSPRALIRRHIEPQVVEVHGSEADTWHAEHAASLPVRHEQVGDTRFYYAADVGALLKTLPDRDGLYYLHRPANLEDVFLKLTGRDLRDD